MTKNKPSHKISQYRDGLVWVAFCTICSKEGDELSEACPGKFVGIKKPPVENVDRKVKKELDESTEQS